MSPLADGIYLLKNRSGQTVVDLINGGAGKAAGCVQGFPIVQTSGFSNQYWLIRKVGDSDPLKGPNKDNQYTVVNLKTGHYLEVASGSKDDKAVVQCREEVNVAPQGHKQHWLITEDDGHYRLQNFAVSKEDENSGFLDLEDGKTDSHTTIQSFHKQSSNAQLWSCVGRSLSAKEVMEKADKVEILKNAKTQAMGPEYPFLQIPNAMFKFIYDHVNNDDQNIKPNRGVYDEQAKVLAYRHAVNLWAKKELATDGYTIMAGMVFGSHKDAKDAKVQRAAVFCVEDGMQSIAFFDLQAQTVGVKAPDFKSTLSSF